METIDDVMTDSRFKRAVFYRNPVVKKVRAWLFLNRYFRYSKNSKKSREEVEKEKIKRKEEKREFLALKEQEPAYDIGVFAPHCLELQNREMKEIVKSSCNGFSHRYFVLKGGGNISPLLIKHGKPRYIIGIACNFELEAGDLLVYNIGLKPYVLDIPQQCEGGRTENYVNYFRNGFTTFLDYVRNNNGNNGNKRS